MFTELITTWADNFIDHTGYFGAAVLMALESMIVPIPSEAVMPFVGMAVKNGRLDLTLAILATSAGSLIGSLISYYLGYFGGKPLILKLGKFLFLNEHHLDLTTAWFHKRGGLTVFIARFVPVVRHLISIPAGIGKMPLLPFAVFTLLGATLWNSLLLYVGYQWQSHIEQLKQYYKIIDVAMVLLILMALVAWYYAHLRTPKNAQPK